MQKNDDRRPEIPDEVREKLHQIRSGLKVTKITSSRSIKSRSGDSFVAFSAAYQSVQDDISGPGAATASSPEEESVYAEQGLSLKDARIARLMLSMECDVGALESALANGSISPDYYRDAVRAVKQNYEDLVLKEMGVLHRDETSGQ